MKNKYLKSIIYLITIVFIFTISEYCLYYYNYNANREYKYLYILLFVSLISNMLIGLMMNIDKPNIQFKKISTIKIDKIKFFLIFLPMLVLATNTHLYHISYNNFIVFSIVAGYILSCSIDIQY